MSAPAKRPAPPDPDYLAAVLRRRQAMRARLDDAGDIFDEVDAEAKKLLQQQYEATRATKAEITLGDDAHTPFATVTRVGGESEAKVTDQAAFQAWVRDTYPDHFDFRIIPARTEIVIDQGFTAAVLAQITAAGGGTPQYVDQATGEIHEVPGVGIRGTRSPYFRWLFSRASKKQRADGRALAAQAVAQGRLDLDTPLTPPALPAGDDTTGGGEKA